METTQSSHLQLLQVRHDELTISLWVETAINYALVHNSISPAREMTISNEGNVDYHDVVLTLAIDADTALPITKPRLVGLGDIPAGAVVRVPIDSCKFAFNPAAFVQLDEAVSGRISMTVDVGTERLFDEEPIAVLARNEWWAESMPESIAAFVMPADREYVSLLNEARELLRARTNDPSLEGYQSGPERVRAIAAAIYDAMAARKIGYINPPPSFEGTGQKIRPPREVLTDRDGTCLDLAVTYAGALEKAGLHPVVFIMRGHAFTGVMTTLDRRLPSIATSERHLIVNYIDTGMLLPVETTALCDGKGKTFEEAIAETHERGYWSNRFDDFRYAVDIASAHYFGVKPLPAMRSEDGVIVVEVEGTTTQRKPIPGVDTELNAPTPRAEPASAPTAKGGERPDAKFPPRVSRWRNALLDLSYRNKLLNMSTRSKGLDLHVPTGSLGKLEDLIFDGVNLTIWPQDQLAEIHRNQGIRSAQNLDPELLHGKLVGDKVIFGAVTEDAYQRKLLSVYREAKSILEETGANNLFLTLGELHWNDGQRDLVSPLFLLPIKLKRRRKGPFSIQVDDGGYTLPNQCLVEKLRLTLGLAIPEFENPATDQSGIDVPASLNAIKMALLDRDLNFHVEETARMVILQFSTLELWQDMTANWEQFLKNPVVRHLVETPNDTFSDPVDASDVDESLEATAYCPIPIDGSQLKAVHNAAAGRSFVLEGPPGTGKSQTITNLISHALASGKRVLFVAEKQVALGVVKRRLDAVGIGDFCLDLHGKNQSPAEVRAQLSKALKRRDASSGEAWDALQSRYQSLVTSLHRYPRALHEVGPTGMSAWTARQSLLATGEGFEFEIPLSVVSRPLDTTAAYGAARDLAESLDGMRAASMRHGHYGHLWGLSRITSLEDDSSRGAITSAVQALADALAGVQEHPTWELLTADNDDSLMDDIGVWYRAAAAAGAETVTGEHLREALAGGWSERKADALTAVKRCRTEAMPMLATVQPHAINLDLDQILARSRAADASFVIGRKKRQRAIIDELAPIVRAGATIDPTLGTHTLERLIQLRTLNRDVIEQVNRVGGLSVPDDWNAYEDGALELLETAAGVIEAALAAVKKHPAIAQVIERHPHAIAGNAEANAAVISFLDAWTAFQNALEADAQSVGSWRDLSVPVASYIATACPQWRADVIDNGMLQLSRWIHVTGLMQQLAEFGLGCVNDEIVKGSVAIDDIQEGLRRGIARAVLKERMSSPGLSGFDGDARDRQITTFMASGRDVREEMLSELAARIIAARSFQSDRLVGKAGQLSRELSRQRGGLKIRELMEQYGSIIGELTPCLMMSPHSVARFLPMGSIDIDIVVFDEASQIRVEEAISAMGRASSTIIVGDSRQMPPTNIGRAGVSEDEDEEEDERFAGVPVDMESILSEAVFANVEQHWLSWHYRSQDESLIAFSNREYYDSKLASFPGPPEPRPGLGVSMRRVGGFFDRTNRANVNQKEADAIIEEVLSRLTDDPHASIGIVTFNIGQMKLIQDALDEHPSPLVQAALAREEDELFVRNLESVQGNEADTILFSLAFSPDPTTGILRLNFGPLTNAGGERRLNVAITRARREVVIFTSFEPSDIDLRRTSSTGMAHLRAYMEMADSKYASQMTLRPVTARDRHLDEVVDVLEDADLIVRRKLGLSDFTVDIAVAQHEEGPWVAVFLDGPDYASRATVGDREALPHAVLVGSMGWSRVERVWMPSWIAEQASVVERIVAATKMPRPEPVIERPPSPPVAANEDDEDAATPNGASSEPASSPPHASDAFPVFRAASTDPVGGKEILDLLPHDPRATHAVVMQLKDVIEAEAPVEAMRLARIVARRFDLQRLAASRARQIISLVPRECVQQSSLGAFVWVDGTQPGGFEEFRVPPAGEARDIAEIAPEEIVNAMRYLAGVGHGILRDELLRETALLFGNRRVAAKIRTRLYAVLDDAIRRGRLADDDGVSIVVP